MHVENIDTEDLDINFQERFHKMIVEAVQFPNTVHLRMIEVIYRG